MLATISLPLIVVTVAAVLAALVAALWAIRLQHQCRRWRAMAVEAARAAAVATGLDEHIVEEMLTDGVRPTYTSVRQRMEREAAAGQPQNPAA